MPTNQTKLFLGNKDKNISRKRFFKLAGVATLIPLAKIWHDSVESKQAFSNRERELTISQDLPDGVHFFEGIVLTKQNDKLKLFSAKCTHLGCYIDKLENEQLVCPCHGSRYNLDGNPILGPAVNSLRELDFQLYEKNENVSIRFII